MGHFGIDGGPHCIKGTSSTVRCLLRSVPTTCTAAERYSTIVDVPYYITTVLSVGTTTYRYHSTRSSMNSTYGTGYTYDAMSVRSVTESSWRIERLVCLRPDTFVCGLPRTFCVQHRVSA